MTKLIISEIDKANHVIVGYLIFIISSLFLHPLLSLIPVILIAAGKEVRDMIVYKREFDKKDFLYTLAGSIPALISLLIN